MSPRRSHQPLAVDRRNKAIFLAACTVIALALAVALVAVIL